MAGRPPSVGHESQLAYGKLVFAADASLTPTVKDALRITRPQESDTEDQRPLDLRYGRHLSPYGLHDDGTPSLHVYPDARRGWFCFGCGRGGTAFDLAAALWGRDLRGASFAALRADLEMTLLD